MSAATTALTLVGVILSASEGSGAARCAPRDLPDSRLAVGFVFVPPQATDESRPQGSGREILHFVRLCENSRKPWTVTCFNYFYFYLSTFIMHRAACFRVFTQSVVQDDIFAPIAVFSDLAFGSRHVCRHPWDQNQ
jgi:hypothetical protein